MAKHYSETLAMIGRSAGRLGVRNPVRWGDALGRRSAGRLRFPWERRRFLVNVGQPVQLIPGWVSVIPSPPGLGGRTWFVVSWPVWSIKRSTAPKPGVMTCTSQRRPRGAWAVTLRLGGPGRGRGRHAGSSRHARPAGGAATEPMSRPRLAATRSRSRPTPVCEGVRAHLLDRLDGGPPDQPGEQADLLVEVIDQPQQRLHPRRVRRRRVERGHQV